MSEELLFYLPIKAVRKVWELNNGVVFPKITFGVTKLEGFKNIYDAVNQALICGCRSFECSPRNDEEEHLGKALQELLPLHNLQRKDIVLCSKVISKNYGKQLTRYRIDPESTENIQIRTETWNEIATLNSEGAIKAAGVCHFTKRHLEGLRKKTNVMPAVNQVEFHPQCPQTELLRYCNEGNIQLWAACQRDTANPLLQEEPAVKTVSDAVRKTPTQVILKWILNKGVGVIVQSLNKSRIEENFELFNFVLGKGDMDQLNSIQSREKYLRSSVAVI